MTAFNIDRGMQLILYGDFEIVRDNYFSTDANSTELLNVPELP